MVLGALIVFLRYEALLRAFYMLDKEGVPVGAVLRSESAATRGRAASTVVMDAKAELLAAVKEEAATKVCGVVSPFSSPPSPFSASFGSVPRAWLECLCGACSPTFCRNARATSPPCQ